MALEKARKRYFDPTKKGSLSSKKTFAYYNKDIAPATIDRLFASENSTRRWFPNKPALKGANLRWRGTIGAVVTRAVAVGGAGSRTGGPLASVAAGAGVSGSALGAGLSFGREGGCGAGGATGGAGGAPDPDDR